MIDSELLKGLKKATEKNLMELGKKPDLNAAETKAAKDAFELLDYLCYKVEACDAKEKGYSQYSGYSMDRRPYREYQITSYMPPHGHMSFDGMMYDDPSRNHYPNTMPGRRSYGDPYAYGYSGHSINDRLISLVEGMYDEAKSDYEREQLNKFISMIRSAA